MASTKYTITQRGYTIPKNTLNEKTMNKLKEELFVTPNVHPDFETDDTQGFKVYTEDDTNIYIPRYYGVMTFGGAVLDLPQEGIMNAEFNGMIRQYQVDIVSKCYDTMMKNGGGLISLSCGMGKTVIAIYLACKLRVKTLVLVHTGRLLTQWIERVQQFTNAKVGIIRQNKVDVEGKDIVIGMLQSVSMKNYDLDIFKDFGLLICDEAHHFQSRVFSNALRKMTTKYTIALSATPERKDGLTKLLYWYLGDLMYKLIREGDSGVIVNLFNYESSNKNKFALKKRYIKGTVKPDPIKMTSNICMLEERNQFITNIISYLRIFSPDRQILVLGMRIEQLEILKEMTDKALAEDIKNGKLEEHEYISSLYIGRMKEYELNDASKANVLFATSHIAKEGLDIDTLNTLILVSPIKDVIQSSGRILRKTADERDIPPMIIDIVDELPLFCKWSCERIKYYKKNKYTINKYRAYNDNIIGMRRYLKMKGIIPKKSVSEAELRKAYITEFYGPAEYEEDLEEEISFYQSEYSYKSNYEVLCDLD